MYNTALVRALKNSILLALPLFLAGCADKPLDVDAALASAQQHFTKGDFKSAVLELKGVLQVAPTSSLARLLLGRTALEIGDGDSAEKEFLRILEMGNVPETDLAVELARARLLKGDFAQLKGYSAEQTRRQTADLTMPAERKAKLLSFKGHAYALTGDLDSGLSFYEDALALNPGEPEALFGKALVAARNGEVAESMAAIDEVMKVENRFAPAWSLLGDVERLRGNLEAAESAYGKAVEYRRNHSYDLAQRAILRIVRGDVAAARTDVQDLQRLAPGSADVPYLSGLLLMEEGRYADASAEFAKALNIDRNKLPALYFAGLSAARQGQWEQADSQLSRFHRAQPAFDTGTKLLAWVKARNGNIDGARALMQQVLARNPNDPGALDVMGSLDYAQGNVKGAQAYFEQLVAERPESSDAYLKLGFALMADGRNDDAGKVFVQARNQAPDDMRAAVLLVKNYLAAGEIQKALDAVERLKDSHPDSMEPWVLLGRVKLAQGLEDEARAAFLEGSKRAPRQYEPVGALVNMSVAKKELEQARGYLRDFLETAPDDLNALLALSDLDIAEEKTTEAISSLERARAAHAAAWVPRVLLARYYRVQGQLQQALAAGQEALELQPNNSKVQAEVGHIRLALGSAQQAVGNFKTWVQLEPESPEAHFYLAKALASAGSLAEAREELQTTLRLKSDAMDAKIVLARLYVADGQIEAADRLTKELTQIAPDHPDVLTLQGAIALKKGRGAEAVGVYRKLSERVSNTQTVLALARSQLASGDTEGALSTLKQRLQTHPADSAIRKNLAHLYFLNKNEKEARRLYLELVKSGEADASVYNNLAFIEDSMGDVDAAVKYAQQANEQAPSSAEMLNNLGFMLMRSGTPDEALRQFQRAVDLDNTNGTYAYHKALALVQLDRKEEAYETLRSITRSLNPFPEQKSAEALKAQLSKEMEAKAEATQ